MNDLLVSDGTVRPEAPEAPDIVLVSAWAMRQGESIDAWGGYLGMRFTTRDGDLVIREWLSDPPDIPRDGEWHFIQRRARVEAVDG